MTDTLKTSPNGGNAASASTPKTSAKPKLAVVVSGTVRLKSLTVGGDNPGTGMFIPPAGQIFEADAERGKALVACGLAEVAPDGAKGE
jgi:hypothetical protein